MTLAGDTQGEPAALVRPNSIDDTFVGILRTLLADSQTGLHLKGVDIAFLVMAHRAFNHHDSIALAGPALEDMFGKVADAAGIETTRPKRRAKIETFVSEMLLMRFGQARPGADQHFVLTPMAREIARAYDFEVDADERERLNAVLEELTIKLRMISKAASDPIDWNAQVERPLRGVVPALVDDIARRQLKLDRQHAKIMANIHQRLSDDWRTALPECQDIIAQTNQVAKELCATILSESTVVLDLIEGLTDLAAEQSGSVIAVLDNLRNEIERLRGWADNRLSDWTGYHRRVGDYVTMLVRTDPDRIVAGRMRRLVQYLGRQAATPQRLPFTVTISQCPKHYALRPVPPPEMLREVLVEPVETLAAPLFDRLDAIKADIREKILATMETNGEVSLHRLLTAELPKIAAEDHNEICDFAVRLLADSGAVVVTGVHDAWPALSLALTAVEQLTVLGPEMR